MAIEAFGECASILHFLDDIVRNRPEFRMLRSGEPPGGVDDFQRQSSFPEQTRKSFGKCTCRWRPAYKTADRRSGVWRNPAGVRREFLRERPEFLADPK